MSGAASLQVIGVADKPQVRLLNDNLRVRQDVGASAAARRIALRLMAYMDSSRFASKICDGFKVQLLPYIRLLVG